MKQSFAPIILVIVAALSMVWPSACAPSAERNRLTHIESIIDDYPDSALTLLSAIDTTSLRSPADRALFAMLLTEALDKNHLNPSDDSLISDAIDYFALNGDPHREMIATYYGGRVSFINNDFSSSIVRFFRAKELAEELGELFWHGMAARGIADIFDASYNFNEQLKYSKEELDYIRLSKRQPYINYSILDLATAYYNYGDHDKAVELAHEMIDSAEVWEDGYLRKEGLKIIGVHYITEEQFDKSLPIFEEICGSGYANNLDSTYLCLSLSGLGYYAKAQKLNNLISKKDDIASSSMNYTFLNAQKDTAEAFKALQKFFILNVKEYKDKIRRNFSNVAVDYYKKNHDIAKRDLRSKKIIWYLTLVVGLLIICIIIGLFIHILQKKNVQIENKVIFANELSEQLRDVIKHSNTLRQSLTQSIEENKESQINMDISRQTIRKLLAARFDLLKELSQIVVESPKTKSPAKKIAQKVTSLIEDFTVGGEAMLEIEKNINDIHNNLIADFRQHLPHMKEEDYRLFMFSVLGFSSTVIALFLQEEKVKSVYNRKNRLKLKIQSIDEPYRSRFMTFLD